MRLSRLSKIMVFLLMYSTFLSCLWSYFLSSLWLFDFVRRPSAKYLLESQYFPPSVRSAYMFLAPLQLSSKSKYRLQYAAKLASEGALKLMGSFAAEMCAPYCLPLVKSPLSDAESESALCLLREFLKCLKNQAAKELILPIIQKILQAGWEKKSVGKISCSFLFLFLCLIHRSLEHY